MRLNLIAILIIGFYCVIKSHDLYAQEEKPLQALELWNFYDNEGDGNKANTTQIRYYIPLHKGNTNLTLRLDTSEYSQFGASYPNQNIFDYKAGTSKITLYASTAPVNQWSAMYGLRTLLPIGAANQWLIAPHVGASYTPKNSVITDISPVARYFYGFDPRYPNTTLVRSLNLFPTIGFKLSANTEARFWDENPAVLNLNNGKWFVPLDIQILHNLDKTKYFVIGTSQGLVRDNNLYTNSTYVSFGYKF
jgi:hypothetical protein